MSDVFAVDLALDLSPTAPDVVLAHLRRHLEVDRQDDWHLADGNADDGIGDMDRPDFVPLLADRGPAKRIGGLLTGRLLQGPDHWLLTVRQELHAELLPELVELAEMLALHARTDGVIGQVRFYEDDIPELLVNRSGTLVKMPLRAADPNAARHLP
ncbi:hypothetical protein SAMN06272771_5125 [Streptomyces sp. Ag82_O1-12]|uniref:hypothetical protein n=1 Tax=unclassified Streptomyces TaxID=2593676 RepID=UPI000BD88984|nr:MULTISPECIES: hypothetical protein [unclassified Streptomyces]SMQ18671.1 hypothetical protein SAMN06272771_5125 [Streptomyces sp. Ag82_O1-12]SOD47710.1 hypothetical protein SAMN06272727_5126 [Streptomyces sp. Ag82_G6-1]